MGINSISDKKPYAVTPLECDCEDKIILCDSEEDALRILKEFDSQKGIFFEVTDYDTCEHIARGTGEDFLEEFSCLNTVYFTDFDVDKYENYMAECHNKYLLDNHPNWFAVKELKQIQVTDLEGKENNL